MFVVQSLTLNLFNARFFIYTILGTKSAIELIVTKRVALLEL
jgi:hypothetical protein